MSGRHSHLPSDLLTAYAHVSGAPDALAATVSDRSAREHLAACETCGHRLAQLVRESDRLRLAAYAEADAHFDQGHLDAQRDRILDRLAHLGRAARVLSFPQRTVQSPRPLGGGSRRWVSVAAAAGLIIGLVAGQLVRFTPAPVARAVRQDAGSQRAAEMRPVMLPVNSSAPPPLTDEELMEEVEAAVQLRYAKSLQALDAFTPTATDVLALGR